MAKPDITPGGGATLEDAANDLKEDLSKAQTPQEWLLSIAQATMRDLSVRWEPSGTQPGQTEVIVNPTPPQDVGK